MKALKNLFSKEKNLYSSHYFFQNIILNLEFQNKKIKFFVFKWHQVIKKHSY